MLIAVVVVLVTAWWTGPARAEPFAYITNSFSNSVSVIDTATNGFVTSIPVGVNPLGVAVNPARTRAFVGNLSTAPCR